MIGVLTMFGETDLQSVLKKPFMDDNIVFISENCTTSVQLLDKVVERQKETDVVIMAAVAMNMEAFPDAVNEIRTIEPKMRIVLILNGNSTQYVPGQLLEFENLKVDILFDDDGFDATNLVNIVKKGKLSRHELKDVKKETPAREFKPIPRLKKSDDIENDIPKTTEPETMRTIEPESFGKPKGKFTIAVFNVSRGSGATTAVASMAQYFAMHGYDTKVADLSGTGAFELVKIKDVEIGIGNGCLDDFKRESNILIIDFGTPYDITPKGDNFKISYGYMPEYIREINKCTIKVIMGFSDVWNVGKIKFLLNNEQWKEIIDNSYIFLISGDSKKLKSEYPDVNIMCRDDDYKEEILNTLREEE